MSSYELVNLAGGVYVWLADSPSHSFVNSGVVIASDGMTVIDPGVAPSVSAELATTLEQLSPLPIKRVVVTGSHIEVVGGTGSFPLAAVYGSGQTSHHLDQPPNPAVWQKLHPGFDTEFAELTTRPITHTVTEAAHLCPASIAVPLGGPQFESLAVQVPSANVVFTGLLASFGVTPLGFEADFDAWIASLEQLATFGEIFVPAHGTIGGREELEDLRSYLVACIAAEGDVAAMAPGPWDAWTYQEFTKVNVERAHMLRNGDPSVPPSMLAMLGMS